MTRIIANVDLSNYFTLGKEWLYETVKSLHKGKYDDDERILFFLDQNDKRKYSNEKGEIESWLDECLTMIDIPEYFVIKRFTANTVDGSNVNRDKAICVLPWIHLYVNPEGDLAPCCIGKPILGNIKDYPTVDEAINSIEYKNLRSNMLSGKKHSACSKCYENEDSGRGSGRLIANNEWVRYLDNVRSVDLHDFALRFYDIRLSNICNFKCRTCSGTFSSSIALEDEQLGHLRTNSQSEMIHKTFIKSVMDHIQDLEEIYFAGGEPLIMEENYQILDLLIQKNKCDIPIYYNTNFSNLKYKKVLITEIWKKFRNITLGLSLDAMGTRAEYLRKGTKWNRILDNIKIVKRECPNVRLTIASTWSIYNSLHLPDFHSWLIKNDIVDPNDITLYAANGDLHDLLLLPDHLKNKAKENAMNMINDIRSHPCSDKFIESWQKNIDYLTSGDKSYLLDRFIIRTQQLDQIRKEDFLTAFPELQQLFLPR